MRGKKIKKILGQNRIQTVHQYFYQSESLLHPLSTLSNKKKIKNILLQRIHSIENFDRQEMIGQRHI